MATEDEDGHRAQELVSWWRQDRETDEMLVVRIRRALRAAERRGAERMRERAAVLADSGSLHYHANAVRALEVDDGE